MPLQRALEPRGDRYRYEKHYKMNVFCHHHGEYGNSGDNPRKVCISEARQPFTDAIRAGNVDAIEILLHTKCIYPREYFQDAVFTENCRELLDLFCHYGFRVNGPASSPHTYCTIWLQVLPAALRMTATNQDPCSMSPYGLDALSWFREQGASLNHSRYGPTVFCLLDVAAEYGSIEGIKFLMKGGAHVENTRVLPAAAGSEVISDVGRLERAARDEALYRYLQRPLLLLN